MQIVTVQGDSSVCDLCYDSIYEGTACVSADEYGHNVICMECATDIATLMIGLSIQKVWKHE